MLILTIVQKFVKLAYREVTFLEPSYLSGFELYRPIITDQMSYFKNFFADFASPYGKFHAHTPSSLGCGTIPPYLPVSQCQNIYL